MEILVVGLMKNARHAREVARALADGGFEREDVGAEYGFIAGLCNGGVPRSEAHGFAEAVLRGGAVVCIKSADETAAHQVASLMRRHGALEARIYRNRRLTQRAA